MAQHFGKGSFRLAGAAALGAALLSASPRLTAQMVSAPAPAAAPAPAPAAATDLASAFARGVFSFNARLRFESGEQSNLKDANALTLGTRFGFTTAPVDGINGMIEGGNTTVISNANDYSAAGTNAGGAGRVSFPDEAITYVNQAWIGYSGFDSVLRVGRQRLNLDNVRFLGDVGWWQKMQTYDSATLTVAPAPDFSLFYGFLWHVSRIYGNLNPQPDWVSRSNVINASYKGWAYGTFTGYAYLLDFRNSAANSSSTYGGSFVGAAPVSKEFKFTYRAEAATQSEAANNPLTYTARYYHGEFGGNLDGYELSADYEVLGSDGGRKGFATPLATLHGFNGWVNEFTATPAIGLRDFFITAGVPLPGPSPLKVVYHRFKSDFGDTYLGSEWDAMLTHKIGKHWTLLGEVGRYRKGDSAAYFNTTKYWLQTEFTY